MLDIIQDIDENGEPVQMDEIDYKIDKIKKGTSEMFSRLIAEKPQTKPAQNRLRQNTAIALQQKLRRLSTNSDLKTPTILLV